MPWWQLQMLGRPSRSLLPVVAHRRSLSKLESSVAAHQAQPQLPASILLINQQHPESSLCFHGDWVS